MTYLMLGAPIAVAPLNRKAFPSIMSLPSTSIAGHLGPIVGVLTSTCIVFWNNGYWEGSHTTLVKGSSLADPLFSWFHASH